ncbi:MAG: hypothetical protein HFP81_02490 [Methylococcales symbiont of Hymedesmia sp. n. MRB-2018]|nr:MAG: hypothetical protein HFP78_01085 [Methylococcales symbiont of Hymedesmia sp. n. MRB-2018]KAF3984398.1 MAG: hypothetical protein HFP81_02490 [Methylococcales symbiont of Hymedesmia sp. n. MRB-2018]
MNKKKSIIQTIANKPFDFVLYLVFAIAIITLYNLYFSINVDDANWDQFSAEHHCKLQKDYYGTQKSSWKCDDGNLYYRWMHQR